MSGCRCYGSAWRRPWTADEVGGGGFYVREDVSRQWAKSRGLVGASEASTTTEHSSQRGWGGVSSGGGLGWTGEER